MKREDAAALAPPEDAVIAQITWALRTLEERRLANREVPAPVIFFLGALDRLLTDEERTYVAMVFGAHKTQREEMTSMLVARAKVGRSGAIAAIRAHLESTLADTDTMSVPRAAYEHLSRLREAVLRKAGQLRDVPSPIGQA